MSEARQLPNAHGLLEYPVRTSLTIWLAAFHYYNMSFVIIMKIKKS